MGAGIDADNGNAIINITAIEIING
jgi:hypothetical protein